MIETICTIIACIIGVLFGSGLIAFGIWMIVSDWHDDDNRMLGIFFGGLEIFVGIMAIIFATVCFDVFVMQQATNYSQVLIITQ